jgi:hypothetical protein
MKMKLQGNMDVGKTYELNYNGFHAVGKVVSEDDFVVLPGSECNPTEEGRSEGAMFEFDILRGQGVLGTMPNGKFGFIKPYHESSPICVAFGITGIATEELPDDIWKEVGGV